MFEQVKKSTQNKCNPQQANSAFEIVNVILTVHSLLYFPYKVRNKMYINGALYTFFIYLIRVLQPGQE